MTLTELTKRVHAELIRSTEVAVDSSRMTGVRSNARREASQWACILAALKGAE